MHQKTTPPPKNETLYRRYVKRALDVLLSLFLLLTLSPVMLLCAVLVRLNLGSPVLFVQNRCGKDGRSFRLYKFRTMTERRDGSGEPLPDGERMTRFGKLLRSSSLDELPELINILRGDMSLVGPRPLLEKYLPLYSERQYHRHDVAAGLTGWAQVNGRNSLSWEQKFEYDLYYSENVSFLFDLKILFMTVRAVLRRDGISAADCATVSEFEGNPTPAENAGGNANRACAPDTRQGAATNDEPHAKPSSGKNAAEQNSARSSAEKRKYP